MIKFSRLFHTLQIILNRKPSIKPSISNKRRNCSVIKNPTKIFYFWYNLIQTNSFSVLSICIISKVIKNRLKHFCIIMIVHWNLGADQLTIKDFNVLNLWINYSVLHGKVYLGHQSHIQAQYFNLFFLVCFNQINFSNQGFRIT
jgi:hypothetical protein